MNPREILEHEAEQALSGRVPPDAGDRLVAKATICRDLREELIREPAREVAERHIRAMIAASVEFLRPRRRLFGFSARAIGIAAAFSLGTAALGFAAGGVVRHAWGDQGIVPPGHVRQEVGTVAVERPSREPAEAAEHGEKVSDVASSTGQSGREKGAQVSSVARTKDGASGGPASGGWEKAKTKGGKTWGHLKEKGGNAWGKTKEKGGNAWGKTKEKGGNAWGKTKEHGGKAWGKTKARSQTTFNHAEIAWDQITMDPPRSEIRAGEVTPEVETL